MDWSYYIFIEGVCASTGDLDWILLIGMTIERASLRVKYYLSIAVVHFRCKNPINKDDNVL